MVTTEASAKMLLGGNQDFSTEFYLTQFKITPCTATYPHNWSLCPFVHPNEKARRRDPRIYTYQPVPCPDDRKGINCPRRDSCQFTHNVYEYWLHPKKFRTQLCHLGTACTRPICFFAHRVSEIRYLDKEEGGGMPPLGATAQQQGQQQQQQQPFMQQTGAGSQAAGAAVRPAVGQLDQAALQQQVVQQVQQGQQQAQHQAQLQQMTLQLQQLQMTQGTPAGPALLSAVPSGSQQQYLIGGQFAGGYGGFAAGTPSHGSGGGMSQSSISGGVPLNTGSIQPYQQQYPQLQQVTPQLQQQYQLTPYAQQQYAQQLQQPYPHPAYQQ